MTTKRFELLQDINTFDVSAKAGTIGEWKNDNDKVWFDNNRFYYDLDTIRRWPSWFREVVEKDWEIVECYNGDVHVTHGYISEEYVENNGGASCEEMKCKIFSVKRLSDQEIFSVGDYCNVFTEDKVFDGTINHFTYCNGIIDVYFKERMKTAYSLSAIKIQKLPTPTKRFCWNDELVSEFANQLAIETVFNFSSDKRISIDKFKASKQNTNDGKDGVGCKTEAERWDEIVGGKAKWPHNESGVKNFGMIIPKQASKQLYTIEDIEKAFEAGKDRIGGFWNNQIKNWQYPTFEDYKKTLEK